MKYKTKQEIEIAKELIACPGDTLLGIIESRGISQTELAMRMGRPTKTINEIIMGKAAITPETAIQLERVIGPSADFWISYERNYRLELAEIDAAEQLIDYRGWICNFPLKEMAKLNWISFQNNIISKTNAILKFFSVANKQSFEEYYLKTLYDPLYRISDISSKNPYSIASWLRQGDIQAVGIDAPEYNSQKFKSAIPALKHIMINNQNDFFSEIQSICLECGVKVIYTPSLPKAPINGATRWIGENPLIQLTDRYHRNDIFWFTFFHETGHILLHGKKDIFIEGIDTDDELAAKENVANAFSMKCTLTTEQEAEIVDSQLYDKESISFFANKFNTSEAIIAGRLAKHNYIHHSFGWNFGFFKQVQLSSNAM